MTVVSCIENTYWSIDGKPTFWRDGATSRGFRGVEYKAVQFHAEAGSGLWTDRSGAAKVIRHASSRDAAGMYPNSSCLKLRNGGQGIEKATDNATRKTCCTRLRLCSPRMPLRRAQHRPPSVDMLQVGQPLPRSAMLVPGVHRYVRYINLWRYSKRSWTSGADGCRTRTKTDVV